MLRLHKSHAASALAQLSNTKTQFTAFTALLASIGILSAGLATQNAAVSANQTVANIEVPEAPSVQIDEAPKESTPSVNIQTGNGTASARATVNGKTYSVGGNGSIHKTEKVGNNTNVVDIQLDSTGNATNTMTVTNNGVSHSHSSSSNMMITSNSEGVVIQQ